MKLRMQLVLAFFLLAVVPLAGVSIYSYNSSLRAVRQAAEEESGVLAAEMGERMESVSTDLHRRIQRLGGFPFRTVMLTEASKPGSLDKNAIANQLMAQMGETAAFVRALEFIPMQAQTPDRPSVPPPPARPPHPGQFGRHPPEMKGLVIHMTGDAGRHPQETGDPGISPGPGGSVVQIEIPMPPPAPVPPPPDAPNPEQVKKIQELALQHLAREAQALKEAAKAAGSANKEAVAAIVASQKELELSLGRSFTTEIRREGELVGEVKAQISGRQILRHVLSRTERKQGEIPFAVDSDGKLYAADPGDLPKIEALPLPRDGGQAATPANGGADKNWVIVTRKDSASGMTFGIARPINERLGEIRRTAARNLFYGMGMVCLALMGILPLSSRMTRNLTILTHGAERLARGDLQARVAVESKDEFGQLALAFNRMAQDLSENQKHLLEQERLRKELEMCRKIQEELLPHQALRTGIIEARGVSIPAREVGGDFFNYFPLPNGDLALLIGDVSGKGLPAAMLMANLQATIQARLPLELDLARLADQLDFHIGSATPSELYLTLFIAILDTKSQVLRFVNAGHNPQFILRAEGAVERLESTGRPLGLLPGGGFIAREKQLRHGDSLFFYTDGLVETEDEVGQEFGTARLEALVLDARFDGHDGMLARVEKATREFRGKVEAADDATMVLVTIGQSA